MSRLGRRELLSLQIDDMPILGAPDWRRLRIWAYGRVDISLTRNYAARRELDRMLPVASKRAGSQYVTER